ncbi:PD-(D/E)XK nuclease family protein [Synechococcus elongatus]|uniref:RecB family exonuclease n=1 Tax=Synechococcus elongatus TaxID=32046 RepID=UPI0030D4289C
MAYRLSATRLQTYRRCAQAYYWRYEKRLPGPAGFGGTALGTSLHRCLAQFHGDWDAQDPQPSRDWLAQCWHAIATDLNQEQQHAGWQILETYYREQIQPQATWQRPLAIEGRIQATLVLEGIEFLVSGRYDRLDLREDGLHLVDYKSAKRLEPPRPEQIDVQLGLYQLALEQRYGQLKSLSLVHLRSGQAYRYGCTTQQREAVLEQIATLAQQIRSDQQWQPQVGEQCRSCGYRRYCPAVNAEAEPIPETITSSSDRRIQLSLAL